MSWVALMVGCGFEVFTFTVVDSSDATIEGTDVPSEVDVMSLDELVNLDGVSREALAEAGVEEGDLSHLTILEMSFAVLEPADADLDFLQAVEVWLSTDALGDVQIASEDPLPSGVTEFPADVTDADLAPYVLGDGLTVSTFATGTPPVQDTTIRTTITVEVGVTARGAWSQLTGR
jgi:hypothetical protein